MAKRNHTDHCVLEAVLLKTSNLEIQVSDKMRVRASESGCSLTGGGSVEMPALGDAEAPHCISVGSPVSTAVVTGSGSVHGGRDGGLAG